MAASPLGMRRWRSSSSSAAASVFSSEPTDKAAPTTPIPLRNERRGLVRGWDKEFFSVGWSVVGGGAIVGRTSLAITSSDLAKNVGIRFWSGEYRASSLAVEICANVMARSRNRQRSVNNG